MSVVGRARLAGALAAAVALAMGELVSSLADTGQSLVGSVGNEIVDRAAGGTVRWAIDVFGTANKTVLVTTIVAVLLLVGAVTGSAALRRPWVAGVVFGGFGVLGAAAGLRDPITSAPWVISAAVLAVAAGLGALWVLLRLAQGLDVIGPPAALAADSPPTSRARGDRFDTESTPTGSDPTATARGGHRFDTESTPTGRDEAVAEGLEKVAVVERPPPIATPGDGKASRRAFFGWSGAAAAFAATATVAARSLRGRSHVERARAEVQLPEVVGPAPTPGASLDVEGLTPYVVPNDRFYRIDTALVTPQVDVGAWELKVTGAVDRPFSLTFDELVAMATVKEMVTLSCVSNEVGGTLVGNAEWQGVPLADLLERAGLQPEATQVVGKSVDGFTAGFPTELALDGRVAMVAVGMNGEPLPVSHGFPARLVVSGLYGYVSATKWLAEIHLTGWDDFDGYWIPRGWAKEGPVKTQSRIDVPRAGTSIHAGHTPIAGVAWAPTRGISKVEVQVDGGPWTEARLGDAVSDHTWLKWVVDWDAAPGEHEIRVRATDGDGELQPEERSSPAPDGATGWHRRTVEVR